MNCYKCNSSTDQTIFIGLHIVCLKCMMKMTYKELEEYIKEKIDVLDSKNT